MKLDGTQGWQLTQFGYRPYQMTDAEWEEQRAGWTVYNGALGRDVVIGGVGIKTEGPLRPTPYLNYRRPAPKTPFAGGTR